MKVTEVILKKSDRKSKKYMVLMQDRGHKHHFGAKGFEDFTTHKDPERKERYIQRHRSREDWSKDGIHTAGFWAKHILWNKPSLRDSIRDTEKKFNIKIINQL